jgi:hypothetical protein
MDKTVGPRSTRLTGRVPTVVLVGGVLFVGMGMALLICSRLAGTEPSSPAYKCFEAFADAFKVALGAFIGMLAQWTSKVFGDPHAHPPPETPG